MTYQDHRFVLQLGGIIVVYLNQALNMRSCECKELEVYTAVSSQYAAGLGE